MNSSYFSGSAGNNNNNSLNQSQESVLEEACAYDVADFLKGSKQVLLFLLFLTLSPPTRHDSRLVPESGSSADCYRCLESTAPREEE